MLDIKKKLRIFFAMLKVDLGDGDLVLNYWATYGAVFTHVR